MSDIFGIVLSFFESYGYVAVVVIAAILLSFIIEMRYIYLNSRVIKHKGWHGDIGLDSTLSPLPSLSVVVPLFGEDSRFVNEHLPLILNQKGVDYEVVVVYVGGSKEFYEDMESLKLRYSHVSFTRIELNERFPISMKSALNIGIKSAKHEFVIFTTPEVYPSSDEWLAYMASGLGHADVVLGYCAVERKSGFGNFLARSYRFTRSVEWLTAAVREKGYRGIRSNIGFRRELYFMAGGFNHLRLNVGVDDLFFQTLIRGRNTEVVLNEKATVIERVWGGINWLTSQYSLYNTTFKLYPVKYRRYVRFERWARVVFYGSVVASGVLLPWYISAVSALLLIVKWGVQMGVVKGISKKVGQEGVAAMYPLYDLFSLWLFLSMAVVMLRKDKRAWR